jgi:hypothetical protein
VKLTPPESVRSDQNSSTGDPRTGGAEWDLYIDWAHQGWDVLTCNGIELGRCDIHEHGQRRGWRNAGELLDQRQ